MNSGVMVGSPVTGDDFFGREQELEELLQYLADGIHLCVSAPRRIGKTSLLLEARRLIGARWIFLFVDVQGCESEPDAVVKLALAAKEHRELEHRVLDGFRNFFAGTLDRLEEFGAVALTLKLRDGVAADWRTKADELLARLAESDSRVVIWFDELPVLISNLLAIDARSEQPERKARTRAFLTWLREASIRHAGKISFVLTGSIGLRPLVAAAGLSDTLNTFTPFLLGAWSAATTRDFLRDRAARSELVWVDHADARLLERLRQPIPHHVQMFFDQIRRDARRRRNSAVTPADVDRVYETILVVHGGQVDLSTYEERLARVVPRELHATAIALLTEAAGHGYLTSAAAAAIVKRAGFVEPRRSEVLRLLLGMFEHDGYLVQVGYRLEFCSFLLRDWWRHRYRAGHTSASADEARR